ncbi:MAG: Hpt domain-containing protein [Methyloligellaceae bacterium]
MTNIDKAVFDKLKERMKGKFPVLLGGYLRDAKAYLNTIDTNLDGGDIAEIIGSSHSLKSASGLLGIGKVHDEAKNVEYLAKDMVEAGTNTLESLKPACAELANAFASVEGELQKELDAIGA